MTDKPQLFSRLARSIFGRYWKTDIADYLSIHKRTIQYWIKGEFEPTTAVIKFLRLAKQANYAYNRETKKMERKTDAAPVV